MLERHAPELSKILFHLFYDNNPYVEQLACEASSNLGFPANEVLKSVRRNKSSDFYVTGDLLSPACYIDQSFPSVLYLATRYHNDFESALIVNTNVGGDNCHRGAVLDAILGAALGVEAIPIRWIQGLTSQAELKDDFEQFIAQYA